MGRRLHRGHCTTNSIIIIISVVVVVAVVASSTPGLVYAGNAHTIADADTSIDGDHLRTVEYAGNSNYWRPAAADTSQNKAPANDHRDAVVDEHLITSFLKTHKHINVATLLVCPSTAFSPAPPAHRDTSSSTSSNNGAGGFSSEHPSDEMLPATPSSDDVTPTLPLSPAPQLRSSSARAPPAPLPATPTRTFINVAKHLMAAGILIKAWNIDSFRGDAVAAQPTSGTAATLPINRKVFNGNTGDSDKRAVAARLHSMLNCGTFKQAIVLDLTCRKSKWVLQQVRGT